MAVADWIDIPHLIKLANEFNDKYHDIPLNQDKLYDFLVNAVESDRAVVLIKGHSAIVGVVLEDPLRDVTYLIEMAWYSSGGADGIKLYKEFLEAGRQLGVDEVRMTYLEGNPRVRRVLERMGATVIETSMGVRM